MVLSDSLRLVTIGILAGLRLRLHRRRLLQSTLFQRQPADPIAGGLALTLLAAVAAVAAWLPARRAARVDPIAALRTE
jgi:putative ABC transport system permease protein